MAELQEKDILEKIDLMKQIVSGFTDVITKENEALQKGDIQGIKALYEQKIKTVYEQKIKTVAAYRSASAFFIKNREAIAAFSGDEKDELRALSAELNKVLRTNELLLKTRMEAGKKVMDTIINIAKNTNKSNATSYGSHGTYTPLDNNRNALAFNRTL